MHKGKKEKKKNGEREEKDENPKYVCALCGQGATDRSTLTLTYNILYSVFSSTTEIGHFGGAKESRRKLGIYVFTSSILFQPLVFN
jgi:hypothetical protein